MANSSSSVNGRSRLLALGTDTGEYFPSFMLAYSCSSSPFRSFTIDLNLGKGLPSSVTLNTADIRQKISRSKSRTMGALSAKATVLTIWSSLLTSASLLDTSSPRSLCVMLASWRANSRRVRGSNTTLAGKIRSATKPSRKAMIRSTSSDIYVKTVKIHCPTGGLQVYLILILRVLKFVCDKIIKEVK